MGECSRVAGLAVGGAARRWASATQDGGELGGSELVGSEEGPLGRTGAAKGALSSRREPVNPGRKERQLEASPYHLSS